MFAGSHATEPNLTIRPLTFLQTFRSAGSVAEMLLDSDARVQCWFGTSRRARLAARMTAMPFFYHYMTSGYGAFVGEELAGWLYVRGWYQVLYVEALAVRPEWRRHGIGTTLMDFAEAQAREQHREWLGLTLSLASTAAMRLVEAHGCERGHWHILQRSGPPGPPSTDGVRLQPVIGQAARYAYRHFAARDLTAGDTSDKVTLTRFLTRDPYHQPGRHWVALYEGQPIAYLNRHTAPGGLVVYVAGEPEWWGQEPLLRAVALALAAPPLPGTPGEVVVRLGSSGHHDAARAAFEQRGFSEGEAVVTRMVKHLTAYS